MQESWTPRRAKSTSCICPRCMVKHRMKLFWTGELPARKFCNSCNQIAERDYTPDSLSISPDILEVMNASL
jgi:hypothetical protein